MGMMKKVIISGIKKAELTDVPVPVPKNDWALVKIHAAPMCCEYKGWQNGAPTHGLGHEAAGEVVAIGESSNVKVGDRVVVMPMLACGVCELCAAGDFIHCLNNFDYNEFTGAEGDNDTMTQYILKPSWLLKTIPTGMSYDHASLACCALGPTFGAMESMDINDSSTILITGAGPVGLGGVVNAKYRGARVIAVELEPFRIQKAYELGADLVLDPRDNDIMLKINDFAGNNGVDAAVDCSGNVTAQRLCIDVVRRKGKVTFVGESNNELVVKASPDFIRKGLTIMGSWHYNMSLFPQIMKVIENSPQIDQLISHVFPMSSIQEAMETLSMQKTSKVILRPWE